MAKKTTKHPKMHQIHMGQRSNGTQARIKNLQKHKGTKKPTVEDVPESDDEEYSPPSWKQMSDLLEEGFFFLDEDSDSDSDSEFEDELEEVEEDEFPCLLSNLTFLSDMQTDQLDLSALTHRVCQVTVLRQHGQTRNIMDIRHSHHVFWQI